MFGKRVFKNFLSWRLHKGGAFYTSSPDHPNYLHCSFQHPKGSLISKIPFFSPLPIFSVLIYSLQSGQRNLTSGSQLYVSQCKSYQDCKFSQFLVPIKPGSWDTWASHLFHECSRTLPTSWPSFQY